MLIHIELTEQEHDALDALAHGCRVKDLKNKLAVSESKAYRILEVIRGKLGANTNVEAAVIATSFKLIEYRKIL